MGVHTDPSGMLIADEEDSLLQKIKHAPEYKQRHVSKYSPKCSVGYHQI
jgi:hypothetical protein